MRTCPKCQRTYPDDMDYCPRDATALILAVTATQAELESSLAQRFRIVRRLGGGGMGAVFLAEQIAVGNRPVALKVLLRKLLDDPEFLMRFRNEAASTGRIDHPNVVTIYESGQAEDGTPYIAMQYLEGETLRARLKSRGALPVKECAGIVEQVARGLGAAHKLGIIHRDLKPDNIFLTHGVEGELLVKLVDFGIAKLRESATHTLTGTVLGTPAYMSFEQASGMRSEELDARSDIYSFGVVAYEMLTGRVPFHSDTPLGYVRKHLSEAPPPFRAVKPELAAPELEQVVMRALAKERDARYASVLEFARAFSEAASGGTGPRGAECRVPLPATKVARPPDAARPVPVSAGERVRPERGEGVSRPVGTGEGAQAAPGPAPAPGRPPVGPTMTAPRWRVRLWTGLAALVLVLGLGGWYVSSVIHLGTGRPVQPAGETQRPSENSPAAKPLGETAPPKTGQLVVETPPEAEVYLDDQYMGRATAEGRVVIGAAKPGEHNLRVSLTGKKDFRRSVTVLGGQEASVEARLESVAPTAGQVRENRKDGLRYVWIPPGNFMMGCSPGDSACRGDEKPSHQVTISKGLWLGQTPVTVSAYRRYAGATGKDMPTAPDFNSGWSNQEMPIVMVTWDDAVAYCTWAGGRLPTEAEWEYAGRAGSAEARYSPIDEVAWYSGNSGGKTHDVAQKRANAFKLYDMLGNVWEWVNDWYGENYYAAAPEGDPQGPSSGRYRVLRGGSWDVNAGDVRVSSRRWNKPAPRTDNYGFRCAREVESP
jgi:formylglycine-generating enzyme required for sulfatase activity